MSQLPERTKVKIIASSKSIVIHFIEIGIYTSATINHLSTAFPLIRLLTNQIEYWRKR